MRKAGVLDDAEQITNPAFRAHQPASRALVSQMAIKTLATDNRQLKYTDRVPMRKSVGGLADENLKDPQSRAMAHAQLVTADIGARVVEELGMAIDYEAQFGNQPSLPHKGLDKGLNAPSASMAAGGEAPRTRNRRRNGQTLGQGMSDPPEGGFVYDPSAAQAEAPMEVEFVAAAGGMAVPGKLTDAIANGSKGRARSAKAHGANKGQGGGRGPTNRVSARAAALKAAREKPSPSAMDATPTDLSWLNPVKVEDLSVGFQMPASSEDFGRHLDEAQKGWKAKLEAKKEVKEEGPTVHLPGAFPGGETQVAAQLEPPRPPQVGESPDGQENVVTADDDVEVTKTLDPYERIAAMKDQAWAEGRGVDLSDDPPATSRGRKVVSAKKPQLGVSKTGGVLTKKEAKKDNLSSGIRQEQKKYDQWQSALENSQLQELAATAVAIQTFHQATVKASAKAEGTLPGGPDNNAVVAAGIASAPGNSAVHSGPTAPLPQGRPSAGLYTPTTVVDNATASAIATNYADQAAQSYIRAQVKSDNPEVDGTMRTANIASHDGHPHEADHIRKVKQEVRDGNAAREGGGELSRLKAGIKRKEPDQTRDLTGITEMPRKKQNTTVNSTMETNPFSQLKRETAVGVTELPYAQMAIITGKRPEMLQRLAKSGHAGAVGPAAHDFITLMRDAIRSGGSQLGLTHTPQLMDRMNDVWKKYSGDETKRIGTELVQHQGGRRDLVGRMLYMGLVDAIAFEEHDAKVNPGHDFVDIFAQAYLTQMGTVSADAQQQAAFNLAKLGVVKNTATLAAMSNAAHQLPRERQGAATAQMIQAQMEHMTRAKTHDKGLVPENPALARSRMAEYLRTAQGFQAGLQSGINNIPMNNSIMTAADWTVLQGDELEDQGPAEDPFADEDSDDEEMEYRGGFWRPVQNRTLVSTSL